MRYLTKKLWAEMNSCDEVISTKAEKEWNENCERYKQQFEEVKEHLKKSFTKEYLSRNGLHDYTILGIVNVKEGRTYTCKIQLVNGIETVLLTMTGLKALQIDIDSFHNCILGKLSWGYSEFDITPEGNISLSVLCDIQNEMHFEFEAIRIIKQL